MKNAFVLTHHVSEHGNAREGAVIRDLTDSQFDALERNGLVREATSTELSGEKAAAEPHNKAAAKPANKGA